VIIALPNKYFLDLGLFLPGVNLPDPPNRRIRIRTYGGVGGTLSDGRSYPDMPCPLMSMIPYNQDDLQLGQNIFFFRLRL